MATSVASAFRAARLPIVVVLGATGTGKSKLALEIASKFKGEIISADSMQVYKGLDIVTNKVTAEEQEQAQHHLLDFVDPLSRYTVVDFRNAALPIIEDLLAKEKIPVIVGGTNYYIESLLWNILVDSIPSEEEVLSSNKLLYDRDKEFYVNSTKRNVISSESMDESALKKSKLSSGDVLSSECSGISDGAENVDNNNSIHGARKSGAVACDVTKESESSDVKENFEGNGKEEKEGVPIEKGGRGGGGDHVKCEVWQDTDIPTEELYRRLQEVDPDVAAQYHPNNRRKIIRSLQVWEQTGRKHSEVLQEQQQQEGGSRLGGGLRYPSTVILWVTCDQKILDERLDRRVDDMIERGLLQELKDFHAAYNKQRLKDGVPADYTKGIFQSIGFKEFHQYLILSEEEQLSEKGLEMYEAGVLALKQVTRRYSRKQLKWIKNRFLLPTDRQVPPVYALDGSDPSRWDERVRLPAENVVEAIAAGNKPDLETSNHKDEDSDVLDLNRGDKTRHECEVCDRVVIGDLQWRAHVHGAKHKKMLRRQNLLRENTVKVVEM